MRGYKKHDNKKLTASPRWTVEGRIFLWVDTGQAVPRGGIGWDKMASYTKKGWFFILFLFVVIAMGGND